MIQKLNFIHVKTNNLTEENNNPNPNPTVFLSWWLWNQIISINPVMSHNCIEPYLICGEF